MEALAEEQEPADRGDGRELPRDDGRDGDGVLGTDRVGGGPDDLEDTRTWDSTILMGGSASMNVHAKNSGFGGGDYTDVSVTVTNSRQP